MNDRPDEILNRGSLPGPAVKQQQTKGRTTASQGREARNRIWGKRQSNSSKPQHKPIRKGGSRMPKYAEFLNCTGTPKAEKAFLLEYQKSVLLALQKEGIIDQFQLEECIRKLELQY